MCIRDSSNDEKIVFSQLGINPLIKLGKEYLSSNHVVRLEDINDKEKQITSERDEKSNNKISSKKSNEKNTNAYSREEVEVDEPEELNPDNKLPEIINENQEIEITDEIDNSRRKRRRSSAIIE